jgi:excisionase family DNA binding protein
VTDEKPSNRARDGLTRRANASTATVPRYVRIDDFAEHFPVDRSTVYRWINTGVIKAVKIAGTRRIPASELERLMPE